RRYRTERRFVRWGLWRSREWDRRRGRGCRRWLRALCRLRRGFCRPARELLLQRSRLCLCFSGIPAVRWASWPPFGLEVVYRANDITCGGLGARVGTCGFIEGKAQFRKWMRGRGQRAKFGGRGNVRRNCRFRDSSFDEWAGGKTMEFLLLIYHTEK